MKARILVVDDEERLRSSLSEILSGWGYACDAAGDGASALARLREAAADAALVDLRMPEMGGIDLLRRMRDLAPGMAVLMMTGYPSVESAVAAMKYGAADFYTKPLDLARVRADLERICAARRAAPARAALRRLDGESAAIRELRAAAERVAPTDAPVVILGESGTGKELAAEMLHALSPRSRAPFLRLNCAAIPESLVESELFGHEKGAFTGAESRRLGVVERAKGGTVFLDEIGDMDIRLQAKLLRVLQDGDYRRVGGSEDLKAEVRVVAATNRDLAALIATGSFREDLYYRLSVICLRMPPLRERLEDLPLLARKLVAEFAARYGKACASLSPELAALLMEQSWPGNVRELKNCLERAVIFCDGPELGPEHLPSQYLAAGRGAARGTGQPTHALGDAREAVERGLVLDALSRAQGNRTRAAELLGIPRRTLYYKLERLGIKDDGAAGAP